MRILITGATGFIGKRFLYRLLEKGTETVCLVRDTSKVDFLKRLDVPLMYASLEDKGSVDRAFKEMRPDIVVHCAASVMEKSEEGLYRANAAGTKHICEACFENGVGRLVYISTIAVVGGNPQMPLTDSMPYKAKNAYGRSKAEAERVVVDFRQKGLPSVIIRPCMIYGEDEPHALDRLFSMVSLRRLPEIDLPGMDSELQLGYVGNVADAMELALYSEKALEGTFIIADKGAITIRKFLKILYEELDAGRPPVIPGWAVAPLLLVPFVKRQFERVFRDRTYDISRAEEFLGYVPRVRTEEGLRITIRDWKEKNSVRVSEGQSVKESECGNIENILDV